MGLKKNLKKILRTKPKEIIATLAIMTYMAVTTIGDSIDFYNYNIKKEDRPKV